jgi:hypothetical protein
MPFPSSRPGWSLPALFGAACLAAAAALAQTSPAPRAGTLKEADGTVWRGPLDEPMASGDGLAAGQTLRTGADGAASVLLRDGTVLTVGPDTELEIGRFDFDATTQEGHVLLRLLRGTMRVITGIVARIRPPAFEVHTPTAVVGVRGTDFIVTTAP